MTAVPTINPNKKSLYMLSQNNDFTEGAVRLNYYDMDEKMHQETIIGYVEKGQKIHSKVYRQ